MTKSKRNMIYAYIYGGIAFVVAIGSFLNYLIYHPELTSAMNFRSNWELYLLVLICAVLAIYHVYRSET